MTANLHPHRLSAKGATALAAATLALAGFWAYRGSFSAPFFFDDVPAIVDNRSIRHLGAIGEVLSPPGADGSAVAGRPVVNLSLAINYALGGLEVRGYHRLNLAVHLLAGLTLFGIVRRTLVRQAAPESARRSSQPVRQNLATADPANEGAPPSVGRTGSIPTQLGLAVALIWTVHPLLTESVTCVVQRTESMMGLFYLLTLYCFIRFAEKTEGTKAWRPTSPRLRRAWLPLQSGSGSRQAFVPSVWGVLSFLACLLGMATKEVMATAPLMVLLYDRTFWAGSFAEAWRSRQRYYLGLGLTWLLLGYLVVHAGGTRGTVAGFGLGVSAWDYALTQARALLVYLKLAFWPHPLVVDYGRDVVTHAATVLGPLAAVALLLAATLYALFGPQSTHSRLGVADRRALGFLGAWFFLILAPSSSVVPLLTQTIAEHRMYLPLAAIVMLVVGGLWAAIGRWTLPITLATAVGLCALTVGRNRDYRSGLSIWQDTVAKRPTNPRALNDLALELAKIPGRSSEAIARYEEALRLQPDYAEAHNNLAIILDGAGKSAEAIDHYRQALVYRPRYPQALDGLGIALSRSGHSTEAAGMFERALRLKPDYAEAHYNYAADLAQLPGREGEAVDEYRAALRIEPDYVDAHYNLANVLAGIPGRLPEAIVQYEEALRLKPDNPEAQNNLGVAYAHLGRVDLAIPHFERALKLNPDFAGARENLEKLRGMPP